MGSACAIATHFPQHPAAHEDSASSVPIQKARHFPVVNPKQPTQNPTAGSEPLARAILIPTPVHPATRVFQPAQTKLAEAAALADGVTSYIRIDQGGKELNPLMPSKPAGIIALTAVKVGALAAIDAYASEELRDSTMASATAVFGAASMNNVLLASGYKKEVAVPIGILTGVGLFYWSRYLSAEPSRLRIGLDGIEYERRF